VLDALLGYLSAFGRYVLLLVRAARSLREIRLYRQNWIDEMVRIGVESLPIVLMAASFSGAVLTLQAGYQLSTYFVPDIFIGAIVGPSIILELAAVSSGFVLASRVGARIAAELGSMRVSEQIDALEVMGLNAVGYLVVPRVLAGVVMFPMLYVAACAVGLGASILAGDVTGFVSPASFWEGARQFHEPFDPYFGLIKSVTFGFIITSVACYQGYTCTAGAEGVGRSTTDAVVLSCVAILAADLALAVLLL
jgi:phospholipid/cholesterol/gamma-HCH transport system permease protein